MPYSDRTTLNNLTPNLQPQEVANSSLRLKAFQYLYDLSDANWDYVQSLVTAGTLSPIPPNFLSRQAIINSNFDVWQRGTSFTNPANGSYTADQYLLFVDSAGGALPTTITHTRQAITPGELIGSFYCYRITTDGSGSGFGASAQYTFKTKIENGTRFLAGSGKKVTISFWARSSIAGKRIGCYLQQKYGTGGSPSATENVQGTTFVIASVWTKYSFTFDLNTLVGKTFGTNNDDVLELNLLHMWGTAFNTLLNSTPETFGGPGTIDLAQIQINAGDRAFPFQPKSFDEELKSCQRYYEKSYRVVDVAGTSSIVGSENVKAESGYLLTLQNFNFKVPKRSIPIVTIYGTQNGITGASSEYDSASTFVANRTVSVQNQSENGFWLQSAAGAFVAGSWERFQWIAESSLP